jgi:large subunit ribosomal protein L25
MNKTISLTTEPRTTVGHKVKHLRTEGKLPATVYGKGFESVNVSVSTDMFKKTYAEAGETHLVTLSIDTTKVPVLIHMVQKHPVTRELLHVEFLKVNLKEKMKTSIPVVLEGEAPAMTQGIGTLIQVLQEIEIEALPTEIPESLVVNVETLDVVDSEKTVKDLVVPAGVTVLTDPNETVVKIGAIVIEKEPEVPETTEGDTVEAEKTEDSGETKEETSKE